MRRVHGIFTGSFDPFHLGHLSVVEAACEIFETVTVLIATNPEKGLSVFDDHRRLTIAAAATKHLPKVKVFVITNKLVTSEDGDDDAVFIRGIRNHDDLDHEFRNMRLNQIINKNYRTVFLPCDTKYSDISSSLIRKMRDSGLPFKAFCPWI